ncbi:cobalt-precorrin-6A reductase, partial [Paraburkholderia sp. Ac-20336]|uniref:precorrin-6A/cobalt-precorrin-6A reductase n=1 Tax=Paraburkholderia sp. Ac-20336 TaxID=2703886 RepID=UPI00197D2D2F
MMRVLLLGGTGDALKIARRLGPTHVYSLAGLGKVPDDLQCAVRVGGFGGADGLARYLESERIGLVIDATHPYAAQISANAAQASRAAHVPCCALRRPAWQPPSGDDWRIVGHWHRPPSALPPFTRPLFPLVRDPLAFPDEIPPRPFCTVRLPSSHPHTATCL